MDIFGDGFILSYEFMQRAFIIGILIGIMAPSIGVIIVLRRLSMIGDSLAHNSLAGAAFGLVTGINPVLGAAIFSVVAALGVEKLRKTFPKYAEISIAIVLSIGVGLAGIFSGFIKNGVSLTSFLFGSIIAITDFELIMVISLSVVVILTIITLFKELFYITFDEEGARLAGVPVKALNFLFIALTGITIAVSSRIVGILVISSLLVIPSAAAIQIADSFKKTILYSVIFGLVSVIAGLTLSFYISRLVPGGTMILVSVLLLVGVLIYKNIIRRLVMKKILKENKVTSI